MKLIEKRAKDWTGGDLVCDTCKGKPDYLYFDTKERKLLSIVCNDCKSAYESMIKNMAKSAQEAFGVH